MKLVDAEHRGADGADQIHHGVAFRTWAFVLAGLGDGLAMEDLLAHLDLDDARWLLADAAFNEALLDDLETGGPLSEVLHVAMQEARTGWTRPIPPLDVGLRAWLAFYSAWAANTSPLEFLAMRGLRAADIHRLHALWTIRLEGDPALQKEALEILAAPLGPLSEPRPEAPRLGGASAANAGDPDHTGPRSGRRGGSALPFAAGDPAPSHPPLSVPLPPPRRSARGNADETRIARGVLAVT